MKLSNSIKVKGAKVHNLKNISVNIPRNKLVVITGVSGSGKSTLAFDVLYAEGQRRYIESLSSYARQFLGVVDKPNVEKIEGISPAIAIVPKKAVRNPRSTVGTITEIYDYLRLLFSKTGQPFCPKCGKPLTRQALEEISHKILKSKVNSEITILAPIVYFKSGEHKGAIEEIRRKGFARIRIDGVIYKSSEAVNVNLDISKKHSIEAVVDSFLMDIASRERLNDSLQIASRIGKGIVIVANGDKDIVYNENFLCNNCGTTLFELEPRIFSFNNPVGACPDCTGLGEKMEIDSELLIPNANLTLSEGAIRPFVNSINREKRQNYVWQNVIRMSEQYKFPLDEPVKDLPKQKMDLVLYGDKKFEGVIPYLENKYKETNSDWVHQDIEQYMKVRQCPTCLGKRLKPEVLAVKALGKSIDQITKMSISKLKEFLNDVKLDRKSEITQTIIKEIIARLKIFENVGVGYLTLDRKAATLAGGEEQRIRLAAQIGAKLNGILYVLDEPSVGLHPRDQVKLIKILEELKNLGNTVIVVEHDPRTIKSGDWVIDIGPGAGKNGGMVVFEGTPEKLLKSKTLTGEYLSGKRKIEIEKDAGETKKYGYLEIKGAKENNLKNIDVKIPLGKFVCFTGVSGSGKSTLVDDILAKSLLKRFYRAKDEPGNHKEILGVEQLNKVVLVDQSPIGRTPRSNPATYTGAFLFIRDIFAQTREAKVRNYSPGRFSFNAKGGRCEACEGQGQIKVEMYFLSDIYVECKECKGKRYNKEALEIEYKGKNIADVLDMTIEEALEFFDGESGLYSKLKTMSQVGLSYMKLGQPATSLSGGEAQRVKLATELSKKDTGHTLYILDEPTTGLHFDDIKKLISVLAILVKKGNTVLCVEHNLDFIKNAEWVIDLGPEGGDEGGYIVAEGTPEDIAKNKKSWTGRYLKNV